MAARIQQVEDAGRRRLPGSIGEAPHAGFQLGDATLQRIPGRVRGARVDVLPGLAEGLPLEGGAGHDRRHHRAGDRIGGVARMDAAGLEPGAFAGHSGAPPDMLACGGGRLT